MKGHRPGPPTLAAVVIGEGDSPSWPVPCSSLHTQPRRVVTLQRAGQANSGPWLAVQKGWLHRGLVGGCGEAGAEAISSAMERRTKQA